MPSYVVDRVQDALNDVAKALNGARVLLLGVTYKADIADQRESPALPIAELLEGKGAKVSYHDPRVATWHTGFGDVQSVDDLAAAVAESDIVVLLQRHHEYDVEALASAADLFFDTRGATRGATAIRL
jgi:UDP-N-acetyl-D-glucosamine dehydrogenase